MGLANMPLISALGIVIVTSQILGISCLNIDCDAETTSGFYIPNADDPNDYHFMDTINALVMIRKVNRVFNAHSRLLVGFPYSAKLRGIEWVRNEHGTFQDVSCTGYGHINILTNSSQSQITLDVTPDSCKREPGYYIKTIVPTCLVKQPLLAGLEHWTCETVWNFPEPAVPAGSNLQAPTWDADTSELMNLMGLKFFRPAQRALHIPFFESMLANNTHKLLAFRGRLREVIGAKVIDPLPLSAIKTCRNRLQVKIAIAFVKIVWEVFEIMGNPGTGLKHGENLIANVTDILLKLRFNVNHGAYKCGLTIDTFQMHARAWHLNKENLSEEIQELIDPNASFIGSRIYFAIRDELLATISNTIQESECQDIRDLLNKYN